MPLSFSFIALSLTFVSKMDNMISFNIEDTENLEQLSVQAFTEELVKNYYPRLFLNLNRIGYALQDHKYLLEEDLLSIHQKMNDELTEMYRKEKLFLFPLLLRLEEEHKTSDSCKPFKNVKYHYTYLVSTIQQFKTHLNQSIRECGALEELYELKDLVQQFEQDLIKVQHCKEQSLYKKFRSCSNSCKSL